MLGFMSNYLFIKIDAATWKQVITKQLPSKILDINLRAFEKGREVASSVNL